MVLLFVVCVLLVYLYTWVIKSGRYWKELGVTSTKPLFLVGDLLPLILQKKSLGQIHMDIYNRFSREKYVGFFNFLKPILLIRDPDLSHSILTGNFSHFMDRGFPPDEESDPFSVHLLALTGTRWKAVRSKLSPIFSTCKLKGMLNQMNDCWDIMTEYIDKMQGSEVELKSVITMFTMNVIASTTFGLDPKQLGDPDTGFRHMAREFIRFDLKKIIKFIIITTCPRLSAWLKLSVIDKRFANYFGDSVMETMEQRRNNKVERNDFIQLMMQIREKGSVDVTAQDPDDEYLSLRDKVNTESVEITDNIVKSQAVMFFTVGFESTSSTLLYTLFEISLKPDLLDKVTMETAAIINKHNGVFSYEALKEMVFLEMCIKETLRLHPIGFSLVRTCTRKFDLPGLTLKEGSSIVIPAVSLNTDPTYWTDPLSFNPERFRPGKELRPGIYFGFGEGPRMCIAMRFAMLQLKLGIAKLLLNYSIELSPKTEIPVRFNLLGFINSPVSPVLFNMEKRKFPLA